MITKEIRQSVSIERYEEKYYHNLIMLLRAFHKESLEEYGFDLDITEINSVIKQQRETSFILLVDGECVGVLAGEVITPIASSMLVYHESIWYVDKAHRKHGLKLFAAAEAWAKENGCKKFVMICMHNSKTDKLFRFYERMGFIPCETHFIKEL